MEEVMVVVVKSECGSGGDGNVEVSVVGNEQRYRD